METLDLETMKRAKLSKVLLPPSLELDSDQAWDLAARTLQDQAATTQISIKYPNKLQIMGLALKREIITPMATWDQVQAVTNSAPLWETMAQKIACTLLLTTHQKRKKTSKSQARALTMIICRLLKKESLAGSLDLPLETI